MKPLEYPLRRGGPNRLTVTRENNWKNTVLTIDDKTIGTFAGGKALRKGDRFTLEDDSVLEVKLTWFGLKIHRNGAPIPGSVDDPKGKVDGAAFGVFFVGIITSIVGLLGTIGVEFIANLGFSVPALIEGLIFVGLAYLIAKKLSMIALIAAIALYTANLGISVMESAQPGGDSRPFGTVAVLIWIAMVQGVPALPKLKAERAALKAEEEETV
ncbi:MAG: hypothetical protein ACPGVO_17115 [Spirulinaceae cyanobacterium]